MLEYILLLSIVVVGLGLFIQKVTGAFDSSTAIRGALIEKQLRAGAAPASIWTK